MVTQPGGDPSMYNVVGQRVATLATGWHGIDEYSARVTASELPSGIYFVRFAMGREVRTTKAVLLK